MTTTSNKTKAFAALNKFASSRVQLIQSLHDAGYTVETARGIVIEWACDKVGEPKAFNVSKSGKVMLDSANPKYEAIKTVVRDVMHMIEGTTRHASSGKKAPADPVEQALKVLGKLTPAQLRKVLAAIA